MSYNTAVYFEEKDNKRQNRNKKILTQTRLSSSSSYNDTSEYDNNFRKKVKHLQI